MKSTKEQRHERAKKWADDWKDQTGEGPGKSGYMNAYLCGYFNHAMTRSDGIIQNIIQQFETLESDLVTARAETEQVERRWMWESHGHAGIYGDDGEMQCGECGTDYKRAPIGDVTIAYQRARMVSKAETAALQLQFEGMRDGRNNLQLERDSAVREIARCKAETAAMLEKAAAECHKLDPYVRTPTPDNCVTSGERQRDRWEIESAIRALITADQAAALAELILKEAEWWSENFMWPLDPRDRIKYEQRLAKLRAAADGKEKI